MSRTDGSYVALNIEPDRLIAVHAVSSGGANPKVVIKASTCISRPESLDLADTAAVGAWVHKALKDAGMESAARRSRVVFAVPRGEVILKRIIFPPGTDESDLPGGVRLQMVRQLTVSPESAAIDFVPMPVGGGASTNLAKTGLSVLAGALQSDRIVWRQEVARHAGLKLARIGLKATGAASLLGEVSSKRGCGVMGITIGCGSTEFVIVENGQLVFARSTDLVRPDNVSTTGANEELFAEKVAVEAKRTWMSHRVTPDSVEVELVVVLGDDQCAALVAKRCHESLEFPAQCAAFPPTVTVPGTLSEKDRSAVAPLVGLIAESAMGRPTLDFANPRKTPDLGAARRQRSLLIALAAILVLGGAYTFTRLDLSRRQERLDELKARWAKQSTSYAQFLFLKARQAHLHEWEEARFDWLAHIGFLTEVLPDTKLATLDGISGRGDHEVLYTRVRGQENYSPTQWSHRMQAVFTLDGHVKRREVADDLRLEIVDDKRYKLDSKGADMPDRFDWRLVTTRAKPDELTSDKPAPSTPPSTSTPGAASKPSVPGNGDKPDTPPATPARRDKGAKPAGASKGGAK